MNDGGDPVLAQHPRQVERLQNVAVRQDDPRCIDDLAQRVELVRPIHEDGLLTRFRRGGGRSANLPVRLR